MLSVLLQMSVLIALGTLWKSVAPNHISPLAHRRAITDLVFYILLPALVLDVIWSADLSTASFQISVIASSGIIIGLVCMILAVRFLKTREKQTGALLLAAAFPNATYLGLPVLTHVLGEQSQSTVVQYDYFACTPILLSVGMLLAQHFGGDQRQAHPLRELIKIPPLWAVCLGVVLNLFTSKQPEFIHTILTLLAGGVVPLMLLVLGMSIRWESLRFSYLKLLLPVSLISLIIVPFTVNIVGQLIGLDAPLLIPVTLLAAMPTMVFGIVICERYQLETELYAAAVTLTTLLSLITLPLWFSYLSVS
jgi:predicted permease